MTSVTVGLIQLDCSDKETPEARTTRALEMTNDTAGDVDLVLLPELWQAGAFNMAAIKECATAVDSTLTNEFRKIAVRHGTWIHAGSLVEQVGEQLFNTAVVIDPSGAITSTYRKIHLYGFDQGEATTMTAGSDVVVADTLLGPTGISTCYDLRFPELYRHQDDRGAQTFLIASGWPDKRIEHWRTLLRARAIEDQAFVLGCNAVGRHAGVTMGGHSAVIAPNGDVIAEGSGVREEVVSATVDLSLIDSLRSSHPWLKDRKL